jgi:hypothetical protein
VNRARGDVAGGSGFRIDLFAPGEQLLHQLVPLGIFFSTLQRRKIFRRCRIFEFLGRRDIAYDGGGAGGRAGVIGELCKVNVCEKLTNARL